MTNAELISKIKAEIERRITDNTFGAKLELIDILAWLDSLESEKPMIQDEDFRREMREWVELMVAASFPEQDNDFISEEDYRSVIKQTARHFAQWGAEHLADERKMIEPEKKEGRTDCSSQGEVPNDSLATQSYENIPNDLEEAAENYIAPIENDEGLDYINFNGRDIKGAFIAGAQWQKDKDTRDMYMSDNRHFQKVYELGRKDEREQMMKEAVEGEVIVPIYEGNDVWSAEIKIPGRYVPEDKVRVIVIPKED